MTLKAHRSGVTSLSAAAMAAATLAGCAPVLHDADLVPARAARVVDTGATRTDSAYANAVAAIDRRDYARALELLQMARQQSAGDVRVLNAMGVVYDKLGRFDLSGRYYAEAAKADPSSPIVQANITYSQRLRDGSAGAQLAQAPIFKVGPPVQAPTPSVAVTGSSLAEARRPAAPERIAPVGPPQQLQAETAVSASRVAGLSQPRVGPVPPPASIELGPLQRIEQAALLTVRRVAGLAGTPSPQITPAPEPAMLQQPAAVTTPTGPVGEIELVTFIKARAAAGLSRLADLRLELAPWNAPAPSAAPGPAPMNDTLPRLTPHSLCCAPRPSPTPFP